MIYIPVLCGTATSCGRGVGAYSGEKEIKHDFPTPFHKIPTVVAYDSNGNNLTIKKISKFGVTIAVDVLDSNCNQNEYPLPDESMHLGDSNILNKWEKRNSMDGMERREQIIKQEGTSDYAEEPFKNEHTKVRKGRTSVLNIEEKGQLKKPCQNSPMEYASTPEERRLPEAIKEGWGELARFIEKDVPDDMSDFDAEIEDYVMQHFGGNASPDQYNVAVNEVKIKWVGQGKMPDDTGILNKKPRCNPLGGAEPVSHEDKIKKELMRNFKTNPMAVVNAICSNMKILHKKYGQAVRAIDANKLAQLHKQFRNLLGALLTDKLTVGMIKKQLAEARKAKYTDPNRFYKEFGYYPDKGILESFQKEHIEKLIKLGKDWQEAVRYFNDTANVIPADPVLHWGRRSKEEFQAEKEKRREKRESEKQAQGGDEVGWYASRIFREKKSVAWSK